MKMVAPDTTETLIRGYETTQRHNTEAHKLNIQRRKNMKTRIDEDRIELQLKHKVTERRYGSKCNFVQ
jgi:ribosomal protein L9